jgi:group I intron endonuclease
MVDTIKNLPEKSGIYKITSPTGKIYIGESLNLKTRCVVYLNPNRVKKQRGIYNSLIKYSIDEHTIEIIEFCTPDELLSRERFWQEHYNSVNEGLNCFLSSTSNKKKELSEDTKKIMSEKSKGSNNGFFNKKHNKESLLKISENSKGCNNPNYGGKFKTEGWLLKQSVSNSKKHLKIIDTFTNEIKIFMNSKQVANYLECSPSSVRTSKSHGFKIKKRYLIKDYNK